jgi:hypothetical protein
MTKRSILLILAHGILGWGSPAAGRDMRQDYYTGLRPFLERQYGKRDDLALTIIAPQVPVSESVAARGHHLKEAIQTQLRQMPSDTRVHILAHSMGGLDGRWVIAEGGLSDRIDSLTTIATPHRGTSLGNVAYALRSVIPAVADGLHQVDHVIQQIEDQVQDSFKWLTGRKIPLTGDHLETLRHLLGNLVKHTTPAQLERGLYDLTLEGARHFNAELAEAERTIRSGPGRPIAYTAYGGDLSSHSRSLLRPSSDLIRVFGIKEEKAEGNDGAVSAWSSHFPWDEAGREYVETLPYDHFGQINWRIPDFRPDDELDPALIPVYQGIMDRIVSNRS